MEKYIFVNPEARVNQNIPNIGLAYAAAYFNAPVIDLNTKPEPKERYLEKEVDVLGISVQSRTFSEAKKIAEEYKLKYPHARVKSISGFLDIQCCYPYLDFEDKIEHKEPFSDQYPFPNYGLFDSFPVFLKKWRSRLWNYAIMTSQGCPYQCIYCMSRNRKWLARGAENCVEELKQAKEKWGIGTFEILDDCFNIDKKRVLRFCELVRPLKLKWFCTNGIRADRFDEEIARAMASAGCYQASFGVESSDPFVLLTIRKGETIEQIEKAVDTAKKHFRSVNGYFIIGLPRSTYEKDRRSLEWAKRKRINAHFSFYVPFDKSMQYDSLFYGEGAKPVSDAYPHEQQRKIYEMTKGMRPQGRFNRLKGFVKGLFK